MRKVLLNLQLACSKSRKLPDKLTFIHWLETTFPISNKIMEVTIRLVNKTESRTLNMRYRNKNYPTNVLSFPFISPKGINIPILGDLVICPQVIKDEAQKQNKNPKRHWAHVVIHGTLHLLGYNHISNEGFKDMKMMEMKIMRNLGYHNPDEL
ncbi:rRNA maturation RNase YbeY [Blochmannia endosymbiont of Colobopsis nipponica]|uniref:rRNA maturation RNase YbeY n=1 Tax=Blochmannia endosymbiont of Colobopsis nipponica TaxID=2681987 RepID=UPI001783514E|nr:rRNA maturation RNase YbeY [Blochmannia endosymbiont of Colobopsis nipponica]QOI11125.1 rRNA maturation RNase YbeY [Blochmannia endosymbiont of Colobopsis nipponica]